MKEGGKLFSCLRRVKREEVEEMGKEKVKESLNLYERRIRTWKSVIASILRTSVRAITKTLDLLQHKSNDLLLDVDRTTRRALAAGPRG